MTASPVSRALPAMKDFLAGLVLVAIAGLYYWAIGDIADSTLSDEVGAGGLPRILAIALALLGLVLVARSWLSAPAPAAAAPEEEAPEPSARWPRAFGLLMLGAAYVALLPFVGYIAGVALLIGAVALYEGAPPRWPVPVAAIGGALLYWALFVKLLGVRQPAGFIFAALFP